jgi:hypothetical protein
MAASEAILAVKTQLETMWPDNCCRKGTMTAGGKTEVGCVEDCPWQELARLVAMAMIEIDLLPPV